MGHTFGAQYGVLSSPGLPSDPARAARQPHGCRPPSQNQRSDSPCRRLSLLDAASERANPLLLSLSSLDRTRRTNVGKACSYPLRERIAWRRLIAAPNRPAHAGAVPPSNSSPAPLLAASRAPLPEASEKYRRRSRQFLPHLLRGSPPRGRCGAGPPRDIAGGRHLGLSR